LTRSSCVSIAERVLERIDANRNLNAFITVHPELIDQARAVDARAQDGDIGPLHGVPVAVKDNIETCDMPTTAGTAALRNLHTNRDAVTVARLRAAGALIIGKTNLDELAIAGRGESGLGGQMCLPQDHSRHPAGSSGGSALAVLTGMADQALGTETVNSLRYPASATGTVAIRPTRATVSRAGVFPQSALTDVVGPMARTVTDAICMLDVLRGSTALNRTLPDSPCIGLMRAMMGKARENTGVNELVVDVLYRFAARHKCTVAEIDDPTFATAPLYRSLAVQVFEVAELFEAHMAEVSQQPGVGGMNGVVALDDILKHGPHAAMVRPFVEDAFALTSDNRRSEIERRAANARATALDLRQLLSQHGLHVIAYPICHRPAARPIGEPSRSERNGVLASALGWPAINLQIGRVEENGAQLPVGLDLTAPPESEGVLLAIATDIERMVGEVQALESTQEGHRH